MGLNSTLVEGQRDVPFSWFRSFLFLPFSANALGRTTIDAHVCTAHCGPQSRIEKQWTNSRLAEALICKCQTASRVSKRAHFRDANRKKNKAVWRNEIHDDDASFGPCGVRELLCFLGQDTVAGKRELENLALGHSSSHSSFVSLSFPLFSFSIESVRKIHPRKTTIHLFFFVFLCDGFREFGVKTMFVFHEITNDIQERGYMVSALVLFKRIFCPNTSNQQFLGKFHCEDL